MNRQQRANQSRRILDANLASVNKGLVVPTTGWVRAIREALGMTREQLGRRMRSSRKDAMGLSASAVQSLESQEAAGTATIDSLRRAAEALDCTFVYVLVPNDSLEGTVRRQEQLVMHRTDEATRRTMQLEAQDCGDVELTYSDVSALAGTSALWR